MGIFDGPKYKMTDIESPNISRSSKHRIADIDTSCQEQCSSCQEGCNGIVGHDKRLTATKHKCKNNHKW